MLQNAAIVHLSASDKIGEAIRRSLIYLPAEARSSAQSLLHPHSLAIVAGTLAVWAGSHAVGIGEVVDVILLVTGAATLGFAVFEGASELVSFVVAVAPTPFPRWQPRRDQCLWRNHPGEKPNSD